MPRATLLLCLIQAACVLGSFSSAPTPDPSTSAPEPDPRVGLGAGRNGDSEASWNLRLISNTLPTTTFSGGINSDLAFVGRYAIQGSFNGFQLWDLTSPRRPRLRSSYFCPGAQSDVSVYRNLLFVSVESMSGRLDCGLQGVTDPVSADRLRGVRIFDIGEVEEPRYIGNVQTCRGSHTHTVVTDRSDQANVYLYVSGGAGIRPRDELPSCSSAAPAQDSTSAYLRIDVIRIPLAAPERAVVVSTPHIFTGLAAPPARSAPTSSLTHCHDITAYPSLGLAAGACGGHGLLLDITDAVDPKRVAAVEDANFSYWHSATFSNDGSKVLFTDEWGGGTQPRCRASDRYEWGADAIFTRDGNGLTFRSYYKMPAAQSAFENCVAHNGSLIPIPGRDVMVQGWYQGGISVLDWTDPAHPFEIAYFDRSPVDPTRLALAGSWAAYWYNGLVVSSEIMRGLDVLELVPSGLLSINEIEAANTVRLEYLNPQEQQRFVWPPSFALARAYLDQLERNGGLGADRIAAARDELRRVERLDGTSRGDALLALARRVGEDAASAGDRARVGSLAAAIADLAAR